MIQPNIFVPGVEYETMESYLHSSEAKGIKTEDEKYIPTVSAACDLAEIKTEPHSLPEDPALSHYETAAFVKVKKEDIHNEPTVFASETVFSQKNDSTDPLCFVQAGSD